MNFTFGIVTGGVHNHRESIPEQEIIKRIKKIIQTIQAQDIPNYEIIVVGGPNEYSNYIDVVHFHFDDAGDNWITKKKNLITQNANFDNIVYMHDYYSLDKNWYYEMLKFGDNFQILINQILDINGNRYHDWEVLDFFTPGESLLPYEEKTLSKFQYISGGFWIAKKNVMEEFPLNESLKWGQGEDVEWSQRVKSKFDFSINPNSIIRLLKPRFIGDERKILTQSQINQLKERLCQ
jgi:hypothetical protein